MNDTETMRLIEKEIWHIAACSEIDPLVPPWQRWWGRRAILHYVRDRFGDKAAESAAKFPVLILH
jgi:hypothetical protein